MNNPTPPKPTAKRTPLSPEAIKEQATITQADITLMLQQARQDNPALYSLLIAVPNAKP